MTLEGFAMTDYMLTAWSNAAGWRDIGVRGAADMHQAIALAEKASGCRVSHGRSGWTPESDFDPGTVIDASSGQVTVVHGKTARPQVVMGPPEVMAAISRAMRPPKKADAG
jgi:hypothetical protein